MISFDQNTLHTTLPRPMPFSFLRDHLAHNGHAFRRATGHTDALAAKSSPFVAVAATLEMTLLLKSKPINSSASGYIQAYHADRRYDERTIGRIARRKRGPAKVFFFSPYSLAFLPCPCQLFNACKCDGSNIRMYIGRYFSYSGARNNRYKFIGSAAIQWRRGVRK